MMRMLALTVAVMWAVTASNATAEKAEIHIWMDESGQLNFICIDDGRIVQFSKKPAASNYWILSNGEEPQPKPILAGYNSPKADQGEFDDHIHEASRKYGIPEPMIKAIIKTESNFNSKAVSRKGALGLMQLMPGTLKDMNVNVPFNSRENILGGVRYLRSLLDQFGSDYDLALAAYNAGPGAVEKYGGVPPYEETKGYVKRVLAYYSYYKGSIADPSPGTLRP